MQIAIPSAGSIGLFAAAGTLLLLTPGPAVLYIVARSIEQGRLAGVTSALGITTGTLVHVLISVLGLSAVLTSSAVAFSVVKYAGAAYLIYLGVRRILHRTQAQDPQSSPAPRSLRRLFRDGFIVNVLNPKTALFFLAFLPQFVEPARGAVPFQIAFLGLLFTLMGLTSDCLYAVVAGMAGGWLKRRRRYLDWERYVTGAVFIGLGLTAALAGGRKMT